MNVLLDHCLDWRLSRSLPGHTIKAAGKLGWGTLKDRALLDRAQTQFDVLVTSDKNLPHQQNLSRFNLAVAILDVPSEMGMKIRIQSDNRSTIGNTAAQDFLIERLAHFEFTRVNRVKSRTAQQSR